MVVLVNTELTPEQLAQIRAVSDRLDVAQPVRPEERMGEAARAEVIFGGFSPALFEAAPRLRWVQVLSAGVDGLLFSEFVASPVTLVSAKGDRKSTRLNSSHIP